MLKSSIQDNIFKYYAEQTSDNHLSKVISNKFGVYKFNDSHFECMKNSEILDLIYNLVLPEIL